MSVRFKRKREKMPSLKTMMKQMSQMLLILSEKLSSKQRPDSLPTQKSSLTQVEVDDVMHVNNALLLTMELLGNS